MLERGIANYKQSAYNNDIEAMISTLREAL